MRIALISNINMNTISRLIRNLSQYEVYETQGYGNEMSLLLDKGSSLHKFKPKVVFVLIDIMELILHKFDLENVESKVSEWFSLFEGAIDINTVYYISDVYLYGFEMDLVWQKDIKLQIEGIWNNYLYTMLEKYSNIRFFSYNRIICQLGEVNSFSGKMWYMGKIIHSSMAQKAIAEKINHYMNVEERTPRKVLLLDLDNTLWKGLAGENSIKPIELSEEGIGLAYKNFQRAIFQMKSQGIALGIVSKNNEEDAWNIINNHPQMVLREADFVISRINWKNKAENIISIAKDLNVGLDSIVFIDDSPVEAELIKKTIPEIAVPDFPKNPEELTVYIANVYHTYFEKPVLTMEDKEKTMQYQTNQMRKELMDKSVDFESYLNGLEMELYRVNPEKHKKRLVQLINKTNQFNLTTWRTSEQEVNLILDDDSIEVFLYQVTDKFGDNGIVAVGIVEYGENAVITEFTMSCRVMGRKIEDAIVEDFEKAAKERGYKEIIGVYKPTEKNKPVKELYDLLGYKKRKEHKDGMVEYKMNLNQGLARKLYIKKERI